MNRSRASIHRTLLAYVGGLFVLGSAVLFLAAESYGRSAADISYDRLLAASVLSIAENVDVVQGEWHVDLPYVALDSLSMAPDDRVFYRVVAPDGSTVTGYDDLPRPPRAADDTATFFDASYHGEPVRFAVQRRWITRQVNPGFAWVQVGQTRLARLAMANDIAVRAVLPIVALVLLALPLLWLAVRRALSPLVQVERDLHQREPSDLRPVSGEVPLELTHLVGALNEFMTRLAGNVENLRAFIADAAHQMRTPLASLRAQAHLAIEEPDPAEQRRSLERIEANAARLSHLVDQMLSDAIVTHRSELSAFEDIDLVDVFSEAVREAVPRVEPPPDVRFASDVAAAVVRGDGVMIREVVKNLVGNALKYGCPERGPIEVTLQRATDGYLLVVRDHGPGVSDGLLRTAFQRFQRGDSGGTTTGAGLGLAIVKRVIDAHGGTVQLANRTDGGLEVRTFIPEHGQRR